MAAQLSSKLSWELANPKWAASLNPVLAIPQNSGQIITCNLVTGANIINHGLGRMMQGWSITDINAAVTVYRSAPFNNSTITLTSSGAATISLEVF